MLQDLTFIGINLVSMVKDDNEINIEGEAGGLGWLPSHNPFHLEQIQRCEQQHHHHVCDTLAAAPHQSAEGR